jgi:phenylacetic acid degradation operon negative regulatory protein
VPGPSPTRPRSLILTVYGAFVRDIGGWVAVADLIRLMRELDTEAQAVRSSISRLKRRGALVPERRDGAVGYALSEEAQAIFAEGDRRIFGRAGAASTEDGWVLALFSVPESERERRHVLRSRLTGLGFGNAAAGVWVAPAHLLDEAASMLRRLGLDKYVQLFRADYLGFAATRAVVAQWWDLDALQGSYGSFVATYAPMLKRWRACGGGDAEAFRDYVVALTDWRRLPYLDPGLPADLLPPDWNGARAAAVFDELRALLRDPALRHVRQLTGRPQADASSDVSTPWTASTTRARHAGHPRPRRRSRTP